VANHDTPSSPAKTETTNKNTKEAVMSKTEKLKLDEGATSTLPPEAFAEFQRATDTPGKQIPGLVRAAEKAQGLLKDAD
jgi:hypothetical protein